MHRPATTMGHRIREARLDRGMRQAELAYRCGCSERTIARWERNDNVPLGKYLRDLAEALDVDALWLLGEANDSETEMVA